MDYDCACSLTKNRKLGQLMMVLEHRHDMDTEVEGTNLLTISRA